MSYINYISIARFDMFIYEMCNCRNHGNVPQRQIFTDSISSIQSNIWTKTSIFLTQMFLKTVDTTAAPTIFVCFFDPDIESLVSKYLTTKLYINKYLDDRTYKYLLLESLELFFSFVFFWHQPPATVLKHSHCPETNAHTFKPSAFICLCVKKPRWRHSLLTVST